MAIMPKKGIFFIFDALIAASIILIGLMLITSFYINEEPTTHLNYLSSDIIKALSELKVGEANNSYAKELINNGNITKLDNSVLEQIGELWAEGKTDIAANLAEEFVDGYVGNSYGVGVYINGESLFTREKDRSNVISSSQKMISGIMKNRTREGYNARATASKIKKNTTDVYTFEPEGSGNEAGSDKRVEITKKFSLEAASIYEATMYLAIHYGTAVMNTQTEFKVNGNEIDVDDVTWSYLDYDKDNTHLAFGRVDVTDYVQLGWNEINLKLFGQAAFHTHLHPGGRIEVSYESENMGNVSETIKKRYYFDYILSKGKESNGKSGAWAVQPVFIPKNVTVSSVKLHIRGESISNDTNKDNVQIYLNDRAVELADPPVSGIFDKSYELKDNVTEGTNVVSVYLNSYPDDFWGDGDTILYSDPKNNPDGSSYVEVEYKFEKGDPRLKYGKIDVSAAEQFGGNKSNSKIKLKDLTGMDVFEAFIEPAQLDSYNVSVFANAQEIFRMPRPLAVPSSVYVDYNRLADGVNSFNITDFCVSCDVLPESLLYYTIYVPSFVGYGTTFDTEGEAMVDARERLAAVLGDYVQAVEINDKVVIIGKVPSMWGPAIAEVRIWQ